MNTKSSALTCAAAALLALPASGGVAQDLTVSGSPPALVIHTAVAGSAPSAALESTTTYTAIVGTGGRTLRARLEAPLPPGVQLRVTAQAPAGATGLGEVTLSTVDQDLVRDLPAGTHSGLGLTYRLTAVVAAGVLSPNSRAVRFTLGEGP